APDAATPAPVDTTPAAARTRSTPVEAPARTARRTATVERSAPREATANPTAVAPAATTNEVVQASPAEPVAPAVNAPAATETDVAPTVPSASATNDWLLPLIGGLAVLVAGAAFVIARRRRAPRAAVAPMRSSVAVPAAQPMLSPHPAVTPMAALPLGEGPGRHAARAEQGPTPDNPFLTRRNRLRRARFYDRRERLALEAAQPSPDAPAPAPVMRDAPAAPRPAAPARAVPQPGFRPQFGWPNSRPAFGDA
ncbi:hypothetical protein, partial [Sphingomonas sp. CCH21-G11]